MELIALAEQRVRRLSLALATLVAGVVGASLWLRSPPPPALKPAHIETRTPATHPKPRQLEESPGPLLAEGDREAIVTIEPGRNVRLVVDGAWLQVPAGAVVPGAEVRLVASPVEEGDFPADRYPSSRPLTQMFTVSTSPVDVVRGPIGLGMELPPDRRRRAVDVAHWDARSARWRVMPTTAYPRAKAVVRSIVWLPGPMSTFAVSTDRVDDGGHALSKLDFPPQATVARVTIKDGRAATLVVPGARLRIPANAVYPGTVVELISQPVETSDFPVDRLATEAVLSPIVTLRSSSTTLRAPAQLRFVVPPHPAQPRLRRKARVSHGCISYGPHEWDADDLFDSPPPIDDGILSLDRLPEWDSYAVVDRGGNDRDRRPACASPA